MRVTCGVQLRCGKRFKDLMLMLFLNIKIDQLALANSVHWQGHVLRMEDSHVLGRALDIEVEGQRKKGRLKRSCKMQVVEESMMVDQSREDACH